MIDTTEYDFNYEMQECDFWISILKPHIYFKRGTTDKRVIEIFKSDTDDPEEKIKISRKEFINFMHYTFPEIFKDELNNLKIEKEDELLKRELFNLNFNQNGGRKYRDNSHGWGTKEVINYPDKWMTPENNQKYDEYFQIFESMSEEDRRDKYNEYNIIDNQTSYTKKINLLNEKIDYFNKINELLRKRFATVKLTLEFLNYLPFSNLID